MQVFEAWNLAGGIGLGPVDLFPNSESSKEDQKEESFKQKGLKLGGIQDKQDHSQL